MAIQAIEDAVEATAEEESTMAPTQALARREPPTLAVTPQVSAEELGERLQVIKQAMEDQMAPGTDYGVIPGTNSKPTLLKPGAEKLAVLFQLDVQLQNEKRWGPDDHLTVLSHATVFHAPTMARLGYGEGVCSTRESKYAYRNGQLTCPECGKPTVRKSRPRPDGTGGDGWYCWNKPEKGSDGCGATFPGTDERLSGQQVGRVDNPDLPDVWNTVVKMAQKRARVDAVLAVTGASALFTQDVEDSPTPTGETDPAAPPYGITIDQTIKGNAQRALVRLVDGDPAAAKAVWEKVQQHCDGYFPHAAGFAFLILADALSGKHLVRRQDDEAEQPDVADAPAAGAENRTEPPSASEIAGLEDQLLEAWQRAGISEQAALKKVQDCNGRPNALQLSLQAAERTIKQRERVSK